MTLSPFRRKTFVGIDLGHHTIKAVQLDLTAASWRMSRVQSAPTPPESVKDGVVVDPESCALAIRQLLKRGRFAATSAIISVAGGSVVVRTVRIPKMPEATLRKSIRFEAGRYVPTSVEDSFIEFDILGDSGDGHMDVMIVAAPRDIVESRVRTCALAGLEVEIVDIEPFAVYRSLIEADPNGDWAARTFALVDIGAATTNLSVISKGHFAMTRTIPQGGHVLTEALKSYFKLSSEDAEAGKAQIDLTELLRTTGPSENPPLRVLQPHVDDLVREIRRSMNYYQSQQTGSAGNDPVSAVVVCGGGAKLPGLPEYLRHKLGLEVVKADVLANPRFIHTLSEPPEAASDLSVASGLAMRAHKKAA
jgi:type IV pilus assembly protein PilM